MVEILSNKRLIDYFLLIDASISNINKTINNDAIGKNINFNSIINRNSNSSNSNEYHGYHSSDDLFNIQEIPDNSYLKSEYTYNIVKMFPKEQYKDIPEINFESILLLMPQARVYLNANQSEFFTYILMSNNSNDYFYFYFYCVYLPLKTTNNNLLFNANKEYVSLYSPKYLCFVSRNPFFASFKYLLEEIFSNSTKNNVKCFKIENILNILLCRIYLPKYSSFQVNFCLGNRALNFYNNPFTSEIPFNLLFTHLSIENAVLVYLAILINSVIIFLHNDLDLLAKIIFIYMKLIHPLPFKYSIVPNLSNEHLELVNFNEGVIIGVGKNFFSDLSLIIKESNDNIIYVDLDENIVITENNDNINNGFIFPINKVKSMHNQMKLILSGELSSSNSQCAEYGINNENILIQSVFYDFIIELFLPLNPKINFPSSNNKKVSFNMDSFINSSNNEMKHFLIYTITLPSFDSFINGYCDYINKSKTQTEEEREKYDIFSECLSRKKKNKDYLDLFKIHIIHTISISSPPYEKLSYIQKNIFEDAIHEKMLKHNKAVELYKYHFSVPVLKSQDFKRYQSEISKSTSNELILLYKKYISHGLNSIKSFYGLSNNYNSIQNNFHFTMLSNRILVTEEEKDKTLINVNTDTNKQKKKIDSKGDYIRSFDEIIKNLTFKGEFHLNIALNITQTYSLCPHCSKPNNIWDIRKGFIFSKAKRETKTKCKFCDNLYVPKFKGKIFSLSNEKNVIKRNKLKSKIIPLNKKENNQQNEPIFKPLEYLSIEHLLTLFIENQNEKINTINFSMFYNVSILMGEIKCLIEKDEVLFQTIDQYLKK